MQNRIKICGITRLEDAQLASDLGAYALGFIFYEKSPRFIRPEAVRLILDQLNAPKELRKVGVFVNKSVEDILEWKKISGIDVIQLHGDEGRYEIEALHGHAIWKAIRLKSSDQLALLNDYGHDFEAFLFDAAVSGEYGGTGHRIAEELLSKIPREKPFILAGGLGPDNWRQVFDRFSPFGVDLSSSVELSPGIKDASKLRQLFATRNF